VHGNATATSGSNYGVYGETASDGGRGVLGKATSATGGTVGVYGLSYSTAGHGVVGYANAATGTTYGVEGYADSPDGRGVWGFGAATSGAAHGVYGESASTEGRGVYGEASSATGTGHGVHGKSLSADGVGVYAENADDGTGAADLALAGTSGVLRATDEASSDLYLYSNDNIALYLDDDNSEVGWFRIYESGNLRFRVEASGAVYADGAYHCGESTTDTEPGTCIIQGTPADFAEMLASQIALEPGDVLTMGEDGRLARSRLPFQQSVVGVYSTRPGDMLASSSLPGHAMGGGRGAPQGSVIGKALEALDGGTGVIQMVVMLQ
jgi:hypothetical protein